MVWDLCGNEAETPYRYNLPHHYKALGSNSFDIRGHLLRCDIRCDM
jgi:hypothetical protein